MSSSRCTTRSSASRLPLQLFDDLLDAFVQDVGTTRYATWDDVLDYCRRSANPVGRLVLRLSGYRDDRLDARVGRGVHGAAADQLLAGPGDRLVARTLVCAGRDLAGASVPMPPSLDARLHDAGSGRPRCADCGVRTRELFERGRPVCDGVSGRLRYELRATWLGGTRILDRLDRAGFDVFTARPKLGTSDALVIACETLLWRETPPSPTRS